MMKNEHSGYRGEGAVDSTEHSEFDFQSRESWVGIDELESYKEHGRTLYCHGDSFEFILLALEVMGGLQVENRCGKIFTLEGQFWQQYGRGEGLKQTNLKTGKPVESSCSC